MFEGTTLQTVNLPCLYGISRGSGNLLGTSPHLLLISGNDKTHKPFFHKHNRLKKPIHYNSYMPYRDT